MKKFKRRSARMDIRHFHVAVRRYFRQIFSSPAALIPLVLEPFALLLILYLVCKKDAFTVKDIGAANIILFVLVVMAAMMGI